jgi:hypothetical protein
MKKTSPVWWDILGLSCYSVFLTPDDTEYTEWKREMGADLFPCVQLVPWSFDLRGHNGAIHIGDNGITELSAIIVSDWIHLSDRKSVVTDAAADHVDKS